MIDKFYRISMYLITFCILFCFVCSQILIIEVQQPPRGCQGGEICLRQPHVVIMNKETRQIEYSFQGNVFAQIGNSPTGYESLFIGSECNLDGCGQKVSGSLASVDFVNGVAEFQDLHIKEAGEGYTLRFIARKVNGDLVADVFSEPFDVATGEPYKLAFVSGVGTAFGGQTFLNSPMVAVVDRGGNIVADYIAYAADGDVGADLITAELTACPDAQLCPDTVTMRTLLQPQSATVAAMRDGLATFEGLYLNRSGYPYQITFFSNLSILASTELASDFFDVVTGPSAKMVFEEGYELAFTSKLSGEFFAVPPRLRLLDAGGNFVATDNSSALQVSIRHNPTGTAQIGPPESLFVVARQGIVSFNSLSLDTYGHNYTLQFSLFRYSPLAQRHIETGTTLVSDKFEVGYGPARRLVLSPSPNSEAGGAWAGNQAFSQQPVLQLEDYGGNPRQPDSVSQITASIVPSLSVGFDDLLVDTTDAPQTTIQNFTIGLADGRYGVGEVVDIVMTFGVNVWVVMSNSTTLVNSNVSQNTPYLELNISQSNSAVEPAFAYLVGHTRQTNSLLFRYVIQTGDSTLGANLDVLGSTALILNNTEIVDGNVATINTTLPFPFLRIAQSVLVDTTPPSAIALSTNTSDGEYGAGQTIEFAVTFDMPVVVHGVPFLLLNVQDENASTASAMYSSTSSDDFTVFFTYLVRASDLTPDGEFLWLSTDSIQVVNATSNTTVVMYNEPYTVFYNASAVNATVNGSDYNVSGRYLYDYEYRTWVGSSIRRKSSFPLTLANYSLAGVAPAFVASHGIVIDTSAPQLDSSYGLQTAHSDGTYFPGEHIFLSVRFDKPVVVTGVGIRLVLDAGPHASTAESDYTGWAYIHRLSHDNVTVEFLYIVERFVNTSALDIQQGMHSLEVPKDTAHIKRASTHPITPAHLNTTALYSSASALRYNAAIGLVGFPPTVKSTVLLSTQPVAATDLYPDDYALIEVTFSTAVVATCAPVLVMSSGYFREAFYASGNGTSVFVFQYTVQMGDQAAQLQYRHTPNALCSVSGCPYRTSCTVLANSTVPSLPVDLKLYRPSDAVNLLGGVPLAAVAVHPQSQVRNTTILSIACREESGEYGAGSVLHFDVTFTDVVVLRNTSSAALPKMYLNLGEFATYSGGNRGEVLTFMYITTSSDVLTSTDLLPEVIASTSSAFECPVEQGCAVLNQAEQAVDLNTSVGIFVASGITLDPTPPIVSAVYSSKQTSPYVGGWYSIGERILIFVETSKPVLVTGFDPRIEMNVTHPERFALYNSSLSSGSKLVFAYIVRQGDFTVDLKYRHPYIDLIGGNSRIYRKSSIPTTLMNETLPAPFPLATSGQIVAVDSMTAPRVTNVSSVALQRPHSVLYAGDYVLLRVDFDREVIAVGNSYLTLNLGNRIQRAHYVGYREDEVVFIGAGGNFTWQNNNFTEAMPNSVSNATRHLYYRYVVQEGDFTLDLDYVDVFSLFPGLTANNDPGYIVHAASKGQLLADLRLPQPAALGSLSADSDILPIDGRRPYMASLCFLSPAGVYSTNRSILIGMNFSSPVVVRGVPSIKLETGLVDNKAFYSEGSGSNSLVFVYTPEPGDTSVDLDYHADRHLFNSARASFRLNGGAILASSAQPQLPADVWLNPPYGALLGTRTEAANYGVARFRDLHIDRRGPDYQLRFSSLADENAYTLLTTTQQPLDVSFSSERQLRPSTALSGHRVGESVAINGNIAVLGCPNCNRSITTVMAVVTSAAEGIIEREVQTLQTTVERQPAKQSFHTTAAVGSKVGGGFRLSHNGLGPTSLIPANADFAMVQAIINFDLPSLGNVSVLRENYIFCACDNAFTWTLVFNDIMEGPFAPLSIDFSGITGVDAKVVGPTIVQAPALLDGTFTISAVGLTTAPISYDAGVVRIKSAFAELGIPVFDILMSPTDVTRSRSWSITFDAYKDSYEMPAFVLDGSGLTGGKAHVFIQRTRPGRHGPFGISGHFSLQWRGNTTAWLRPNTTASEMKLALEALPVINFVNVKRSKTPVNYGYTWTIEMVSVNRNSPRGLIQQETSNLEPLIPINELIATEPQIEVQARYDLGSRNQITGIARQGTYGHGAGAVHVYQRRNETWDEIATLSGNDTAENTQFGGSVALLGDILLVGAIGGNMNGRPEKQAIFCSATGGYFKIHFRGWNTSEISYNVTRTELVEAILSDSRFFDKLYTVTALEIDDWGGGGLCNNNTAVLTFFSPVDGATLLLGQDTRANLELLTFEKVGLNGVHGPNQGVIFASEVQPGTWRLHNNDSDPQHIGSAYIFRASYQCVDGASELCRKTNWTQEALLFPTTSRVGSKFGTVVALSSTVALIGAPGSLEERGVVYAFEYSASAKRWNFLQMMTYPLTVAGDNFGSSVAISGDTVVIGASNYESGIGGVFVFTRPSTGGAFIAAQSLLPASNLFTLSPGVRFGAGIAIEGNIVVVGTPGYNDKSVYFGDQQSTKARVQSGAVFLFERVSPAFNFKFLQRLNPSNVQEFDGFGTSLDLDGRNLVVTSLQQYGGPLLPDKPVVEVITHSSYAGPALGGSFKLSWLTKNDGETFTTRFILHDTTADRLRRILEEDLQTGPLLVSRSRVDVYDGGYSWSITFMGYDGSPVPLFQADTKLLTGLLPGVQVRYVNPTPDPLRGKAHLFQKPNVPFGRFVEQMLLSPHSHQAADRCGTSAGLSGKYALIGCPNRDQRVPSQNSGVGFMYHLGLLAVEFSGNYTVLEGNTAPIAVVHDAANFADIKEDVFFYTETVDRNAVALKQRFVQHLFGIPGPTSGYPDSMLDRTLLVGKATARSQFYGSAHNESRWVDGMYDYRGISDYVPINQHQVFLCEDSEVNDAVVTTADSIFETPDEYIVLGITSPGVWPSVFGRLYGQIRIYDPADGNLWEEPRYHKLYDTTSIATEGISALSASAIIASTAISTVSKAERASEYGRSVAYVESLGVIAVGAPSATVSDRAKAGKVVLYHQDYAGNWTQHATYLTTPEPLLLGTRYGDDVALSRIYDRNVSILAIGEPSLNKVHIYISEGDNVGASYDFDTTLTWNDEKGSSVFSKAQRFGERGTIALHGFLLVVAAPALESVWAYRRIYSTTAGAWIWSDPALLQSSDFDYDIIQGSQVFHRQDFGAAVGVYGRNVLVGAPFADYDNLGIRNKFGENLVETQWDTEGTSILSFARGRAYVFYSAPAVQEVLISSATRLYDGEFQLNYCHQGVNETTTALRFDSTEADVASALLALSTVDDVSVSTSTAVTAAGFQYAWTVTFLSDWEDEAGVLRVFYGCENCTMFNSVLEANGSSAINVSVTVLADREPLVEVQSLSASDRRNGDRFGSAVAINGDQIVVGAPFSATITTTTWNFEAGTLLGWHRTGNAFNFQPTFRDNSYLRGGRTGRQGSPKLAPQSRASGQEGLYYIGTFEKRPGNPLNYQAAHPLFPEGNTQGDSPRGTLSSDVFLVRGTTIKFLVGGGCDVYTEFVELVVDGFSVAKHTGQCSERMRQVSFDVAAFRDRAAQIRIVDNSTANWGHINVDNFQFDWDIFGASIPQSNRKTSTGGTTEAPQAGAAYLFRLHDNSQDLPQNCVSGDKRSCSWSEEVKLTASDKRSGMMFGSSVAINDAAGVVLVGAPNAALTGFYKEIPSVFPFRNSSDSSTVTSVRFPTDPANMLRFQSAPVAIPERSGAKGVWSLELENPDHIDFRASEQAGAVYTYVKQHQKLYGDGRVAKPQSWSRVEHSKLQPPDAAARDYFASSLGFDGASMVLGAPGQDGLLQDAGAIYLFNTEYAALSFSAVEYTVKENRHDGEVTLTLLRDVHVYSGAMVVEFATSDLTARGVDEAQYKSCMSMSPKKRAAAGCGDYVHTVGVVVFAADATAAGFTVRIVDDLCRERFMEYIQVTISVPGSAALQGELLSARIRIDDDDYEQADSILCGA